MQFLHILLDGVEPVKKVVVSVLVGVARRSGDVFEEIIRGFAPGKVSIENILDHIHLEGEVCLGSGGSGAGEGEALRCLTGPAIIERDNVGFITGRSGGQGTFAAVRLHTKPPVRVGLIEFEQAALGAIYPSTRDVSRVGCPHNET